VSVPFYLSLFFLFTLPSPPHRAQGGFRGIQLDESGRLIESSISFVLKSQNILSLFSHSHHSLPLSPLSPPPTGRFSSASIQLDESGRLAESSIGNVAILTPKTYSFQSLTPSLFPPSPPSPPPQGGFLGIQLDESGRLAESSIGNVAILTPQGTLRTPPFENILAGTTVKRLWKLAEETLKPQGKKAREGLSEGRGPQGESLFDFLFLIHFPLAFSHQAPFSALCSPSIQPLRTTRHGYGRRVQAQHPRRASLLPRSL